MMEDQEINSTWFKKGATLSDKSSRNEFGLTQEEIIEGIEDGKLHYRTNSVFGNPYYKLKKLKKLKTQVAFLELRKAELLANLDDLENND
jgi:hypothetical protein